MNETAKSSLNGNAATWHAIAADEVVKAVSTSAQKGLSASEAAGRLHKYGPWCDARVMSAIGGEPEVALTPAQTFRPHGSCYNLVARNC